MGYDVTWTDTDIVWFQNPIPLMSAMESDFVVQSNAPSKEADANGALRINSGFYRVRSNPSTIAAMEQIVMHAAASRLTEQPSFYMVLCGGKEGTHRQGTTRCIYPLPDDAAPKGQGEEGKGATLAVDYLDRRLYPAGAYGDFWTSDRLHDNGDLVILHNNWIKGMRNKIQRLVDHGLWFYNRNKAICSYDQHPRFTLDWAVEADG